MKRADRIRFWDCVPFGAPDYCWRWTGNIDKHGQARFRFSGGRNAHAAAVMLELLHGGIGEDQRVQQDCDQPDCVNPRHLSLKTKGVCAVEGCTRKIHAKNFCPPHYKRLLRHGDPAAGKIFSDDVQRFFELACEHKGIDCLIWPFRRSQTGYARGTKTLGSDAHRAVCEAVHGPPSSPDMHAAHLCGNRSCVNPGHLEWSSQLENMFDLAVHRALRGEGKDPYHVVTDFCGKHNADPVRFAQRSARITRIMHHQLKLRLEAAA